MRPERLLPLIVATALFIENMDSTAIATSLPQIAADLGVEPVALKLALTTYMLALAVFIPVSGWVADRFGARPTFMVAIGVFLLGSLGCAASGSLGELVAARFLQGTGGAMMVPVGRLVLLRSVPKSELVRALSWLTIPALLGPMLGPVLGGLITTYGHWRFIFLINIPMGLLGIWLAWRHIPLLRSAVGPLDWRGFALISVGLALTIFGFASMGRHLVSTPLALACTLLGSVLLALYWLHSGRHPHPLLRLDLFRLSTFRNGVIGGSLFRIGIGATPFLLPLMLQMGFGLNPLQSGLITFTSAAGAMFMKTLAAGILKRFGFRPVLIANALIASVLLCGFGLFRADTPYPLMVGVLLVSGCFRSLQFTSLNAIVYADVEPERMSQASSLAAMAQQVSLAIGITIGGYALTLASAVTGDPLETVTNFGFAFLTVGLISATSVVAMWRLAPDAGAEMSGRARAGEEVSEPKPMARPGT
ncbi:MFS transporter [Luteimonas sp. RD2P54]|uniref:MFS transporter n=1 Tax=Luteimonas endophytica TaxID=3042023 RepID=A0ABT6JBY0_9GAMM|nr:MFS transporter [Luteimonas endophytica]MDH5824075.1 MFS transporter [Luteimonas endophytica]